MKKVVFFTDLNRLNDAFFNFDIQSFSGKKLPVKLHMGEIKNKYYSKPDFVRFVINELKKLDVNPYLFDTTVAYAGLRNRKAGYKELAKIHGFTKQKIGCNVSIDDSGVPVKIENRDYEVAKHLIKSTHIFALTHVKGHIATGMGGAIKNFGMGGVTKETKIKMHHGSRPIFKKDACTYCEICSEVCPFNAIKVKENNWKQNMTFCFGCGVCVDSCKYNALTYKDADFQYVLACAAKACVQNKKVIYLNELKRIAKSCDCDPFADPLICPDIGYLVSDDPVAIDKASLDLIDKIKKDIFEKENHISPLKQIKYGEKIGLGSSSYKLVEL
ncbi:MAG: DUF362 domain-containing protein [Thermoplasmatales archaeon]|nr:MAG: DUF362 domain-containing protein [Thermoplasmatales archaeon]